MVRLSVIVSVAWLAAQRILVASFISPRRQPSIRRTFLQAKQPGNAPFSKSTFLQKGQFDPLSLRSFRRETLITYSSTNQSEPLRILIWGLCVFVFALAPQFGELLSEPLDGTSAAASAGAAIASLVLFNRERGRRASQLVKLEREVKAGTAPLMDS